MAFRLLPREDEYFALFSQMTATIQDAANTLMEMTQGSHEDFERHAKNIKKSEHLCDDLSHKISTKLNKSFITPFDREDIYMLVVALDDVLDYIDAGARVILMYDIKQMNSFAVEFAKVIQALSMELNSAISILDKPTGINTHIVEIHRLENEADDIYFRAIGELFRNEGDPIMIIKWKEFYEILESATDRCESVANIIESIILKHN